MSTARVWNVSPGSPPCREKDREVGIGMKSTHRFEGDGCRRSGSICSRQLVRFDLKLRLYAIHIHKFGEEVPGQPGKLIDEYTFGRSLGLIIVDISTFARFVIG